MTHHALQGRLDTELLWTRRRGFLQQAAAWTSLGGFAAAQAQSRSNVVALTGDALLNGRQLSTQQTIQTGDRVETGPGSSLVFVIGNSSFQMRQNSAMVVERGNSLFAVSVLRLIAGGVVSVWGRGGRRQIVTPTLTAGIRGTGVYTEIMADQGGRSYFCNCYGIVEMGAGNDRALSQSSYHQAFWGEVAPGKKGRMLTAAPAINHSDEEVEFLARLVNQETAWQRLGTKGVKDGLGFMETRTDQTHPADIPGR
jgi:hypothetical protein